MVSPQLFILLKLSLNELYSGHCYQVPCILGGFQPRSSIQRWINIALHSFMALANLVNVLTFYVSRLPSLHWFQISTLSDYRSMSYVFKSFLVLSVLQDSLLRGTLSPFASWSVSLSSLGAQDRSCTLAHRSHWCRDWCYTCLKLRTKG